MISICIGEGIAHNCKLPGSAWAVENFLNAQFNNFGVKGIVFFETTDYAYQTDMNMSATFE